MGRRENLCGDEARAVKDAGGLGAGAAPAAVGGAAWRGYLRRGARQCRAVPCRAVGGVSPSAAVMGP